MRRPIFIALLAASAVVYACSEASDGSSSGTSGAIPPGSDGGGSSSGASGSVPPPPPPGGPTPIPDAGAASAILINEISGTAEWIELVNSGAAAVDISGYKVADAEKEAGAPTPKLSEAATMPSGTILSPHTYVVVKGGDPPDGGGPKTCPDGGLQSYCVLADFGVSNKAGETIFFLTPSGQVISSAVYPPNATVKGESLGRIPNADPAGTFVKNVPTPGAANQAQ